MIRRALVAALAAAAVLAGQARADGDPASDVLVVDRIFVPFEVTLPAPVKDGLNQATLEAKQQGYPIRVALITTPSDLGAVPSLFGKPQTYAQFLWEELSFVYHGRVLVVMPNGFGIYAGKVPVEKEKRLLAAMKPGVGANAMAASALNAVLKLAAASGHQLSVKPVPVANATPASSSTNEDRFIIGGAVLAGLLVTAAAVYLRRRVRRPA